MNLVHVNRWVNEAITPMTDVEHSGVIEQLGPIRTTPAVTAKTTLSQAAHYDPVRLSARGTACNRGAW